MSNPWLNIPLADYEGHMKSAEVQQLDALAELFAEALASCRPVSLAVLGIAGGNGLDRVNSSTTKRVVGLDVNPLYLDETRRRYADKLHLELSCVDLANLVVNMEPVQLVHAALVFEHAGVDLCLENALSLVAPGGTLSAVLQWPSESAPGVGASQFPAMQKLKSRFSAVDPAWFQETVARRGFSLRNQVQRSLPSGKGLWMGVFRR
jgi:hypothetical protein